MFSAKKRIVIIGATSAIAEHCARLWIQEENIDLTLIGRNENKLENIVKDLGVRNSSNIVRAIEADFVTPDKIQELVDNIAKDGPISIVLIAHGFLPDQEKCQNDLVSCNNALVLNGISPVLFAEAFVGYMQKNNRGTVAIVGSVAGDRGRKSNYVYGSAKGLIDRYVQGLQHRLAQTNVSVLLIKPGPTDTPMTADLKQLGFSLASVESVSDGIVKGIKKKKSIIYVPAKWALIMFVVKNMPSFLFNKLNI